MPGPNQKLLQQAVTAHRQGDLPTAERIYKRILRQAPRDFDALHLLGVIRAQQRDFAEAERLIARALEINHASAAAHSSLGNALTELGRPEEAIVRFRRALALKPDFAEAHYNLGNALRNLGQIDKAVEAYGAAIKFKPDYRDALLNLALVLRQVDQPAAAVSHLRRAIELNRNDAEAHNILGLALQEAGRPDEARGVFERAITLAPSVPGGYFNWVHAAKVNPGDPPLIAMEALARDAEKLAPKDRAVLYFALGKAYEDVGRYDEAFENFLIGNRLKRTLVAYDEAADRTRHEEIRRVFDGGLMTARRDFGSTSQTPIFIVGFPRSGTTLVEQILASHPQVHGAGELGLVGHLASALRAPDKDAIRFPDCIPLLDASALQECGARYVERLRALAPAAGRITDKLPENYFFLGFIHLILPKAHIIHVRRDPLDTCISCFSQHFGGELNFAYDLAELGGHYRRYEVLMEHWRGVLPEGVVLEVQYEALVADIAGETRRILERCGLSWDDRCLRFHETRRPVRTASVTQVRRPLYRSSLQRSRYYEKQLAPLRDALGLMAAT